MKDKFQPARFNQIIDDFGNQILFSYSNFLI